ncbi:hypothetical protein, partial [Streptomyces sp. MK37H]|uniref:hypothetical protein n=1 Tax=Streptomyces sp. MK37H TaxID=2699117 RepID=UPI001B39A60D
MTAVDAMGTLARLRKSRKMSRAVHATYAMILTGPDRVVHRGAGDSPPRIAVAPLPRPAASTAATRT